eukprot:15475888-Alexandrium_andersonii.AAC.1
MWGHRRCNCRRMARRAPTSRMRNPPGNSRRVAASARRRRARSTGPVGCQSGLWRAVAARRARGAFAPPARSTAEAVVQVARATGARPKGVYFGGRAD